MATNQRVKSNRTSECKCKKPKSRFLNDAFKTEICDGCMTVLSFERPIKIKSGVKTKSVKKVKSKRKLTAHEIKVQLQEVRVIDTSGLKDIKVNTGYNEDNFKTMSRMPDGFVDIVITSPPYNVGEGEFSKYEKSDDFKDEMTEQEWLDWQVKTVTELLRVTRTHIFYNVQMLTNNKIAVIELIHHFKDKFKELAIWNKKSVSPASTKGVMSSAFELLIIFSHDEPNLRVFKDGNFHGTFKNVVEVHREKNELSNIHKATMPVNLPRVILKNFGRKGDLCYDPYGGTFTTPLACIMEKRRWIASELSEKYFKAGMKRIKNAVGVGKLDLKFEDELDNPPIDLMKDDGGKVMKQVKLEL